MNYQLIDILPKNKKPEASKFDYGDKVTVRRNMGAIVEGTVCRFLNFESGKYWIGVQTSLLEEFWVDPNDVKKSY
jgi:hypothetical protein